MTPDEAHEYLVNLRNCGLHEVRDKFPDRQTAVRVLKAARSHDLQNSYGDACQVLLEKMADPSLRMSKDVLNALDDLINDAEQVTERSNLRANLPPGAPVKKSKRGRQSGV